jgi:gamma-glutamyltranspeptidase/glutathione hydrolase
MGETLFREDYAKTLGILAERGVDAFYEGEIAEALVKVVRERGGLISLEDLKGECGSSSHA